MSLRKYNNRKRRRAQAFPEEKNEAEETPEDQQTPVPAEDQQSEVAVNEEDPDTNVGDEIEEEVSTERAAKELAVWETFREEHYEVLEQLPLSLHRAYTLLHELDEQVETGNTKMLNQIQKYISMRQALASPNADIQVASMVVDETAQTKEPPSSEKSPSLTEPLAPDSPPPISPSKRPRIRSRTSTNGTSKAARERETQKPTPLPPSPPPPETTRGVIAELARQSEQVLRAANEKVNVARFACDLIDRYIRDMDREIKEQETSLSLGLRPGTHPASIVLPEVVLPKPTRAPRAQETPFSEDELELDLELESPHVDGEDAGEGTPEDVDMADGTADTSQDAPAAQGQRQASTQPRRRVRRNHGWSRKKPDHTKERDKEKTKDKDKENNKDQAHDKAKEEVSAETTTEAADVQIIPAGEEAVTSVPPPPPPPPQPPKLTLTLPPLASILPQSETEQPPGSEAAPAGEDEQRYCYCNGVSWGEMVGCDGCDGWVWTFFILELKSAD
ncbi:hypothetical protein EIP86_007715 [Pleurotus ostreatoroseus]|nr:hypothetical protein EIP86_007715 [Pleurotus ostreatoroseus]